MKLSFNLCKLNEWNFLIVLGSFFIKLSVYLFHMWLSKTHVGVPAYQYYWLLFFLN